MCWLIVLPERKTVDPNEFRTRNLSAPRHTLCRCATLSGLFVDKYDQSIYKFQVTKVVEVDGWCGLSNTCRRMVMIQKVVIPIMIARYVGRQLWDKHFWNFLFMTFPFFSLCSFYDLISFKIFHETNEIWKEWNFRWKLKKKIDCIIVWICPLE